MLFDYTTLLISYTHNGDDKHKDHYVFTDYTCSFSLAITLKLHHVCVFLHLHIPHHTVCTTHYHKLTLQKSGSYLCMSISKPLMKVFTAPLWCSRSVSFTHNMLVILKNYIKNLENKCQKEYGRISGM